jgi:hydrogenase expression/formation protein HypC
MCVTSPGRVRSADGEWAVVDLDGVERRASLALVPDAAVGDWVLVAAGLVLEVLGDDDVRELRQLLDGADRLPTGVRS